MPDHTWLQNNDIKSLFHKAITCASTYIGPSTNITTEHNDVTLHLLFHPNDPASYHIQDGWRNYFSKAQWKMHLENKS